MRKRGRPCRTGSVTGAAARAKRLRDSGLLLPALHLSDFYSVEKASLFALSACTAKGWIYLRDNTFGHNLFLRQNRHGSRHGAPRLGDRFIGELRALRKSAEEKPGCREIERPQFKVCFQEEPVLIQGQAKGLAELPGVLARANRGAQNQKVSR